MTQFLGALGATAFLLWVYVIARACETRVRWWLWRQAGLAPLRLYALGWTLRRQYLRLRAAWQRRPGYSSRADLPCRPGHARHAKAYAAPEAGPAQASPSGPAGAVPDPRPPVAAGTAPRNLRYPALNPRLYDTGAMPGISQEAADELWWSL